MGQRNAMDLALGNSASEGHIYSKRSANRSTNSILQSHRSLDLDDAPVKKKRDAGRFKDFYDKNNQKRSATKLNQISAKGNLVEFQKLYAADPKRLRLKDGKGVTPAHRAAESGHEHILKFIYEQDEDRGAIFNQQDKKGNTVLHVAIRAEQTDVIDFLLDHGAGCSIQNNDHQAPIHYAVELSSKKSLKALLGHSKVDPNEKGEKGQTALHLCAAKDRHECAKILLAHGALPCQKCDNGYFPINVAGKCASAKTLEILIKHVEALGYKREDVLTFTDKENNMPLHCAVNSGDIKAVIVCLEAGAPIDAKQEDQSTPLHFACTQGSVDMVEVMYEKQPEKFSMAVHTRDVYHEDQSTPLHFACTQGSVDMVEVMYEKQPEKFSMAVHTRDVLDMTPLHRAALFDHVSVVEFLLNHGADIDAQDSHNRTPLLLASSKGGWRTVQYLLKAGANLAIKDKENRNFLHLAIRFGMPVDRFGCEVIKRSIEENTKVLEGGEPLNLKNLLNERDDMGCTPLHYASKEGHLVAIDDLLKHGAIINPKDNDKKSPLHFAARFGRYNTCRRLLESSMGPNIINETDGDGLTALHYAAQNGHVKIIKILMQKGAYVTKDNDDNTPLHHASENGYTRSMKLLLTVYPNLLDTQNKEGQTALHMAAEKGQSSAVKMLLDLGASFKTNCAGDTFFDIAIREGHSEVAFAIIHHNRWDEALDLESKEYSTPLNGLVQFLPDVCLAALDRCHTTSGHDKRSPDFCIGFKFKYLQSPSSSENDKRRQDEEYTPMLALNTMVRFGRVQCLSHTVSEAFLNMKWRAYGSWFHITNLVLYAIYLGLLTSVVTSFMFPFHYEPLATATTTTTTTTVPKITPVPVATSNTTTNSSGATIDNSTSSSVSTTEPSLQRNIKTVNLLDFEMSISQKVCIFGVVVISVLNMIKEIVQIIQQRRKYFKDITNMMEWFLYISSVLFVGPLLEDKMTEWQWVFGSIAIFLAWFNCLLFLQRFDFFGIYVVMFLEILRTLVQVLLVFSILLIAFAMAFYMLLRQEEGNAFSTPGLSLLRMAMMMLELDYVASFSDPYTDDDPNTLFFGGTTIILLVIFVLLMPILLMNLLIGLAVGDIVSVQKNATLKRLAMQVELHTDLERKLPARILDYVNKSELKIHPNRREGHMYKLWDFMGKISAISELSDGCVDQHQQHLYEEMYKQKYRMKEMSCSLQKQYELLRLIVQKMEIHTEEENRDEGEKNMGLEGLARLSKYTRPRQAMLRQGAIVAHWKNSMQED